MKTLERICELYLKEGILKEKPLSQYQHAYRSGRSVECALHLVVGQIEKSLNFGELSLGAFLDVEGAFDKVGHTALERALRRKGIDDKARRWLLVLLGSREVQVTVGGNTLTAKIHCGCPQGGILSPLLWNLAIEDLLEDLNEKKFFTIGYAYDDH